MSKRIVLMWAFFGLFVIAGFQNCSKVAVGELQGQAAGIDPDISLGDDDVRHDGDISVDDHNDSPNVMEPNAPSDPVQPPMPPVVTQPDPSNTQPGEPTRPPAPDISVNPPKDSSDPQNPPLPNPSPTPAPTPPVVVDDTNHDDTIDDIDESQAASLCMIEAGAKIKGHGTVSVANGAEIVNVRGPVLVQTDLLNRLENIRGLVVIRGKTAAAAAKLIKNIRGSMVLCGLSIDEIDDVRGSLLLVNSNVKSLSNHRGNVKVMNSEIGSTSNLRGSVKEVPKK